MLSLGHSPLASSVTSAMTFGGVWTGLLAVTIHGSELALLLRAYTHAGFLAGQAVTYEGMSCVVIWLPQLPWRSPACL